MAPLTMIIDAALDPAEIATLPARDLSATTCVVFDVLRATSSMITALAHGVAEILPVRTIEEAFALRSQIPGALLGGERDGEKPEGFDFGNSPLEYRDSPGARIVWTTTNGTIALRACEHAGRVLVGALLNLDAIAAALRSTGHVLLVCAGTHETLALEDVCAAGHLAALFPGSELTDAARTARALAQAFPEPLDALRESRNGRRLIEVGRGAEVEWCARRSAYSIAAALDGSVVRAIP
ncbi:MAG: 2-phosphosulfolactate phosphatase [Chthoniobacteraceae bacterium]